MYAVRSVGWSIGSFPCFYRSTCSALGGKYGDYGGYDVIIVKTKKAMPDGLMVSNIHHRPADSNHAGGVTTYGRMTRAKGEEDGFREKFKYQRDSLVKFSIFYE